MHSVEYLGKCRKLVFERATGHVVGKLSGGGACNDLTGDEFLQYTFNDVDAHKRFGCIEAYFNPLGNAEPETVDLDKVDELQSKAGHFLQHRASCTDCSPYGKCAECVSTFEDLCSCRDTSIVNKVKLIEEAE